MRGRSPFWSRLSRLIPLALGLTGCSAGDAPAPPVPAKGEASGPVPTASGPAPAAAPLAFRAQELPFVYERGETGKALPTEVSGGGVGLLDVDGDGDLDLFLAQGGPLPEGHADVLLRNDGKGQFTDISAAAGLIPKGYGQGVTVADHDADGDPDVYVTRYGRNTLWRNDGKGHFTDVTDAAGVAVNRWSLGAAFLDYDRDGDLDLFVANYFSFDESQAPYARTPDGQPDYGTPAGFAGQPDTLFRNDGNGTFTDVTESAGVAAQGRGMGVLAADFDADGLIDILVANDAEANALWRNQGDGTFEDIAPRAGLDLNGQGSPEANMGIALADTDGDGLRDVVITHFLEEHDTLWRAKPVAEGGLFYQDETFAAGLGSGSRPYTGWGVTLADFDHDGHPDLLVTNGHIRREPNAAFPYENPPILWHNRGDGRFRDVTATAGPYFTAVHMGRGLTTGDLDGDGDLDVVVTHHNAPAVVLWNESPRQGQALRLDLKGSGANPDAVGAVVTATVGDRVFVAGLDGGGGYLSSPAHRIHLGLGDHATADRVEVRWPSGRVETREQVPTDAPVHWVEGESTPAGR